MAAEIQGTVERKLSTAIALNIMHSISDTQIRRAYLDSILRDIFRNDDLEGFRRLLRSYIIATELKLTRYIDDIHHNYGLSWEAVLAATYNAKKLFNEMISNRHFIVLSGDQVNPQTLLHICAIHGSVDVAVPVIGMLNLQANQQTQYGTPTINSQDIGGNTPLHLAAQNGKFSMVKLLAKEGANLSLTNNAGKSAVKLATKNGYNEIAWYLIRYSQKHQQQSNFLAASHIYSLEQPNNNGNQPTGVDNKVLTLAPHT